MEEIGIIGSVQVIEPEGPYPFSALQGFSEIHAYIGPVDGGKPEIVP